MKYIVTICIRGQCDAYEFDTIIAATKFAGSMTIEAFGGGEPDEWAIYFNVGPV